MIHGTFDNFVTTDTFAQFKRKWKHAGPLQNGDEAKACCILI